LPVAFFAMLIFLQQNHLCNSKSVKFILISDKSMTNMYIKPEIFHKDCIGIGIGVR